MSGIQPAGIGPAKNAVNFSAYKLGQMAGLPVSLEMEFNMPPGTEPCEAYSIQGHLNSAEGEAYTARDLLDRLFLNDGAPFRSAILDKPDQKISDADRARLARPESIAALGKLISDHNGGALISGELTYQYRTYLYTCYQQKVEQGLIKENPNKEMLNSLYRFYTHGPQGRRPYIKVPVRELAKLANEFLADKTAAPTPRPAPAKNESRPTVQPVIVDKPAVKTDKPAPKPAALPFMNF